jgi:hypothetical protein
MKRIAFRVRGWLIHKLFIERELGYQLAILNIPVCAHLTRSTSTQDSRLIDILHRVLRY